MRKQEIERKINVLVTGAGGAGVGEGIVKALKMDSRKYRIVVTDEVPMSAALFRADKAYLVSNASDEEYIDSLIDICRKENIAAVIPGSVPELRRISDEREKFEREEICPIVAPKKAVDIGLDKWKTYEFLSQNGFPYPKTYLSRDLAQAISELGFPLFIKPRDGYGSRNTYIANDEKDVELALNCLEKLKVEPLIQQLIQAQECTVGVVVSKSGRILGSISVVRELKLGFSYRMQITDVKEAREISEALALKLGVEGPLNVQLFLTKEKPIVFEINPRFSGTTPVRSAVGFREVDAVLRNFLFGDETELGFKRNIIAIRFLDELYASSSDLNNLGRERCTTAKGWRKRYF